jgi:hypothetical protein
MRVAAAIGIATTVTFSMSTGAVAQTYQQRANQWVSQQLSTPPQLHGYRQYTGGVGIRQAVRNPVGAYATWSWNFTRSVTSAGNAYATMQQRRYYGRSPMGW